jgi:hypothetical protein
MVYGLLGLCAEIPDELAPDYSLSAQDVYRKATLFSLKSGNLGVLCGPRKFEDKELDEQWWLSKSDGRKALDSMPSWVYNWDARFTDTRGNQSIKDF